MRGARGDISRPFSRTTVCRALKYTVGIDVIALPAPNLIESGENKQYNPYVIMHLVRHSQIAYKVD